MGMREDFEQFKRDESANKSAAMDAQAFKEYKSEMLGGSLIDPIARGSSFNLNDEISGAIGGAYRSVMPELMGGNDLSFIENYGNIRDPIRERTDAYGAAYPGRALGGEIGGAVLGGGLGFSNYLRGKTGAELANASMKVGGLEGGIQGYGASDGGLDDIMSTAKGAAMGGLAGAAMPLALQGMKGAGSWLWDKLPFDRMRKNAPAQFVKDTMEAGGETEFDVIQRANKMGPNATFMETADTGIPMGQAVLGEQPGLIRTAREGLSNRIEGSTDRVASTVESLTGRRPPVISEIRALAANRLTDSNAEYSQFSNIVPDFDDTLDGLMKRPAMKTAWAKAKTLAANRGEELPELFEEVDGKLVSTGQYPDFKAWDYMKSGLWDAEQAAKQTDGYASKSSRAIGGIRRELTNRLDELYPDYKQARDSWGIPSQRMEMIERGEDFFKMKPNEFIEEVGNLSPSEKTDFITGAWESIQERMGRPQEGFKSAYSWLNSKNNKAKMRALFPDGDEGDDMAARLRQSIEDEGRLRDANNKVVENSQTFQRQAARDSLRGTGIGIDELVSNPISSIGRTASNSINRMPKDRVQELGRKLFEPGGTQDVFDWVNQLAIPMSQRNNLRGSAIRGFDTATPYGLGAIPAIIDPFMRDR